MGSHIVALEPPGDWCRGEYFLAPKSEPEARQWIANQCLDGIDTLNKAVRHTRRQAKDVMDQGQEKISEVLKATREATGKS